jgi:hypothetical protein
MSSPQNRLGHRITVIIDDFIAVQDKSKSIFIFIKLVISDFLPRKAGLGK